MDEFKKQLGKKIRQIRNRLGLTQDDFCEKIKIEPQTLSKIENGKSYPTLITLKTILDVFNIEPNEVFDFQHLLDEETIDSEINEMYKSLSLEKKQYLYRLITFLFETN